MKNLNKRELKKTVHNHSSNTDFKDFMTKTVLQNHILFNY